MSIVRCNYTIQGLTPLMMANPAAMMAPKPGGGRVTTAKRTPEEEAEMYSYRNTIGALVFPATGVRNSALSVASKYKAPGAGRSTLKRFTSHIQIDPADFLPVFDGESQPIGKYEIDSRRAVIPKGGGVIVHRPVVTDWRISFCFLVEDATLGEPEQTVRMLLIDAGINVGIGAFRPERGGWFGRFRVLD